MANQQDKVLSTIQNNRHLKTEYHYVKCEHRSEKTDQLILKLYEKKWMESEDSGYTGNQRVYRAIEDALFELDYLIKQKHLAQTNRTKMKMKNCS